ncbi:hypothetical protein TIFTF001_047502 [Ficus carica]|uniref:Uncharacterized protein n=1 Tax=Ficus carica TaxID=3494 RepID=A0AA87ZB23_FICCA|nr:hypothetical protein TIFTF001_047502 [Ficus carica]
MRRARGRSRVGRKEAGRKLYLWWWGLGFGRPSTKKHNLFGLFGRRIRTRKLLPGFWEDEEEERGSRGSCCQDFGNMKKKNGEKQGKLLLPGRKSGSRNLVNFGEKKGKFRRRGRRRSSEKERKKEGRELSKEGKQEGEGEVNYFSLLNHSFNYTFSIF